MYDKRIDQLVKMLKHVNGADNIETGKITHCSFKTASEYVVKPVFVLVVRQRFLIVYLFVTIDFTQIGVATQASRNKQPEDLLIKPELQSASWIDLPETLTQKTLDTVLMQLGFSTDGN